MPMDSQIEKLKTTFEMLPDWEERYRFIIDLGRKLEPMPEADKSDEHKVRGCMSQVWLTAETKENGAQGPVMRFRGDSDAHIVRGLIAVLFMIYSNKHAREIVDTDIRQIFEDLQLEQHITANRRNGLHSMVETIRRLAAEQAAADA